MQQLRKINLFFRHNPKGKKFNTFRAGIAKLHNMKRNVYDYVMTASVLHQSLYGNIKSKQRQRNVCDTLTPRLSPFSIFGIRNKSNEIAFLSKRL